MDALAGRLKHEQEPEGGGSCPLRQDRQASASSPTVLVHGDEFAHSTSHVIAIARPADHVSAWALLLVDLTTS